MMVRNLWRLYVCLLLLTVGIGVPGQTAAAEPGDLDETFAGFGSDGVVITSGEADWGWDNHGMALQPDGKIVIVGITENSPHDSVVMRYLPNGDLDSSFSGDGAVAIDTGQESFLHDVAIQADGKIVVAGYENSDQNRFMLARLSPDGVLDPSFGGDGVVITDFATGPEDEAMAILVQPDGKIVACGNADDGGGDNDMAVARYHPDGSLDAAFDGDGLATIGFGNLEYCNDIDLQGDGKLVLVGDSYDILLGDGDFAVARLNPDGTLDDSFDLDGKLTTGFGGEWDAAIAVAIQPDGKILAAGDNNTNKLLARYLPDGTLDDTFDGDGKRSFPSSGSLIDIALQPDGKILLLGGCCGPGWEIVIFRMNSDGVMDDTFNENGMRTLNLSPGPDKGHALALLADGRMILYGESNGDHALAQLWPDGSLDTGGVQVLGFEDPFFGINSQEAAQDLALQPDGKIVLAGFVEDAAGIDRNFALARFHPGGLLDTSFGTQGRVSFGFAFKETANAVAIQPDGKIVVAGTSDIGGSNPNFMIARFNPDGSPDGDFGFLGFNLVDFLGQADNGNALALAPDGKIVVAGQAQNGVNTVFALTRFNDNGVLDTTFDTDGKRLFEIVGGSSHNISAVIVQPNLKIIVAGSVIANAPMDYALVRFNPDGSLDYSFGVNGYVVTDFSGDSDSIHSLVRQSDGSLIAAGNSRVNGEKDFSLARYTSSGVLDTTFGTGGKKTINFGGSDSGNGLDVRGDGTIVVAGCSDDRFALAQLLWDGYFDPNFGSNGVVETDLEGEDECAAGVKFVSPDRVLAAGNQFVDGNRNMALARYETTVWLGNGDDPPSLFLPLVLR